MGEVVEEDTDILEEEGEEEVNSVVLPVAVEPSLEVETTIQTEERKEGEDQPNDLFDEKEPSEIPSIKRSTRKKTSNSRPVSILAPPAAMGAPPVVYPCNLCAKQFNTTNQLNGHKASHKKSRNLSSSNPPVSAQY